MTHIPTSSTPTRLDASQGAPFPPNASFDSASVQSTMHQTPGLSCPPSTSLPILTLPEPSSVSATSPMPDYHGQDNVYSPANQPCTGMLPSDANAAFLQSEGNGSRYHTAPLTFKWALPMKVPSTAGQQTMCQVFPSDFRLRVKNKTSNTCRNSTTSMNEEDPKQYYCDLCEIWVLLHRKKYHSRKHNGEEFICKICELFGDPCKPFSRKDALKRHIEGQHPAVLELLRVCSLRLLVPRQKNEREDLVPLMHAMLSCVSE